MSETELTKKFETALGSPEWTLKQYNEIYSLLEDGAAAGVEESLLSEVQQRCEDFEAKEATYRVEKQMAKETEKQARIKNGRKSILHDCSELYKSLQVVETQRWDKATLRPELNGLLKDTPVINELIQHLRTALNQIKQDAYEVSAQNELDDVFQAVQKAGVAFDMIKSKIDKEIERRERLEHIEKNDRLSSSEALKKRAQEAAERKLKEENELLKASMLRQTKEIAASTEQRISQLSHELEAVINAQKRETKVDEYKFKQQIMAAENAKQQEEFSKFEKSLFGEESTTTQAMREMNRSEASPDRIKNTIKGALKLKTKSEEKKQAGRTKLVEAKKKRAEVELARIRAENLRLQQIAKAKELGVEKRALEIKEALANFEEDENDGEEERRARADARKFLMKFDGDVWKVAREGDFDVLQKFFLVEDTTKLLKAHNMNAGEGGRTLLHTTAWYGHIELVKLILLLGADVNAIDTTKSRTTALMEAARAGRKDICIELMKYGADIWMKDAYGDTALHWAARKGWGSILVTLVNVAEKNNPGSTKGVFDVQNFKGRRCLSVAKNKQIVSLAQQELGVSYKDESKKMKSKGKNRKDEDELSLDERSPLGPDQEFKKIQRVMEAKIDGLSDLGLRLSGFEYKQDR